MPIRKAIQADLTTSSHILANAFFEEAMFGAFIHPKRHEFPEDMHLYFLRQMRVSLAKNNDHDQYIVTYKPNADGTGEECITGVAHWVRKSPNPPEPSLTETAAVKAAEAFNASEELMRPNRALEPSRADTLERTEPFIAHNWTGTRAEGWYLSLIGVSPDHEKKGYGRELVQYGFDLSRKEGVVCSVISAEGRERFYQSCGFDVTLGRVGELGGEANPARDVAGGTIHFWDNGIRPEGIQEYNGP
ncbi:hypothetical protein MBLNU230_g5778t1 [Neophaeotheca triangularis]